MVAGFAVQMAGACRHACAELQPHSTLCCSLGLLLIELTTRKRIMKRGQWELPQAPDDCPQVGWVGSWFCVAVGGGGFKAMLQCVSRQLGGYPEAVCSDSECAIPPVSLFHLPREWRTLLTSACRPTRASAPRQPRCCAACATAAGHDGCPILH